MRYIILRYLLTYLLTYLHKSNKFVILVVVKLVQLFLYTLQTYMGNVAHFNCQCYHYYFFDEQISDAIAKIAAGVFYKKWNIQLYSQCTDPVCTMQ